MTSYSFAQHGQATQGERYNHFTLRSDVSVYKPSWKQNAVTTVRIFPTIDRQTGQFAPFRNSAEQRDYSDWIRGYETIVFREGAR